MLLLIKTYVAKFYYLKESDILGSVVTCNQCAMSCLMLRNRTYRYVFPRSNLDVDLMNEAAQKLVGTHDFRNFCKRSGELIIVSCR